MLELKNTRHRYYCSCTNYYVDDRRNYGKELIQATIKIVDMSSGKGNHDDR